MPAAAGKPPTNTRADIGSGATIGYISRHHGKHAADQSERRPRAGKNDFKAKHMAMMLPFLTSAVALWLALMGKRGACLWLWLLTLIIFAVWCHQHMTGTLPISL